MHQGTRPACADVPAHTMNGRHSPVSAAIMRVRLRAVRPMSMPVCENSQYTCGAGRGGVEWGLHIHGLTWAPLVLRVSGCHPSRLRNSLLLGPHTAACPPPPPLLTEMVILRGVPPSRRLTAITLLNSVGEALMTASPAARSTSITPLMPGVFMSTITLNDSPCRAHSVGEGRGGEGSWE